MAAKRPTPPKEPRRSSVRFNAVKHGIFSVSPVIPFAEREADWRNFRDSIFESINPEDGLQIALADRVAALLWRMMRIIRYERESVANLQAGIGQDWALGYRMAGQERPREVTPRVIKEMNEMLMARLMPGDITLNKIMRYETRLHRHLLQTLHQIALLKRWTGTLPHNSKHGMASLDPPVPNRNHPALPQGPSLTSSA